MVPLLESDSVNEFLSQYLFSQRGSEFICGPVWHHTPRPEFEFGPMALFAARVELDGKLIHKSRFRSGCSSSLQAAFSIGDRCDRSCWKKSAMSAVLGFCSGEISCSGTDGELRVLLLLWGGHRERWVWGSSPLLSNFLLMWVFQ